MSILEKINYRRTIREINSLHSKDEHQKIVDMIEALPENKRTPELVGLQARAYNNLGRTSDDMENFVKAIELLHSVENELKDTMEWNYRKGYAMYYLGYEYAALRYFEKTLEISPKFDDAMVFANYCRRKLSLPIFNVSFRQRTGEVWAEFLKSEAELRTMLDNKQHGEELVKGVTKILKHAFADPIFEIGGGDGKYELILSPNGVRERLFPLVYFRDHAPAQILENWDISIGRRSVDSNYELRMSDMKESICAGDVTVWIDKHENCAELKFYSPKLLDMQDYAYWAISILLDQVIGELAAMTVVGGIEVLSEPKDEHGIPMTELYDRLSDEFDILNNGQLTPENMCETYSGYQMEPNPDSEEPRSDIYVGITSCYRLLGEYYEDDTALIDEYHDNGIAAGYFVYPLDCIETSENFGAAVLDFRESIQAAIEEKAGADCVKFIGGATGVKNGYIDFIAWDSKTVYDAAEEVFGQLPVRWVEFNVFRKNVESVVINSKE